MTVVNGKGSDDDEDDCGYAVDFNCDDGYDEVTIVTMVVMVMVMVIMIKAVLTVMDGCGNDAEGGAVIDDEGMVMVMIQVAVMAM